MSAWASNDIPSLHGRLAVITGAHSGIGSFVWRVRLRPAR